MKRSGRVKRAGSPQENNGSKPGERATKRVEGRLLVGNVEVLALTDGEEPFPFSLNQLFPTVPAEGIVNLSQIWLIERGV